jgi:hypothetical protein
VLEDSDLEDGESEDELPEADVESDVLEVMWMEEMTRSTTASKGLFTTCILNLPFPKTQMLRVSKG